MRLPLPSPLLSVLAAACLLAGCGREAPPLPPEPPAPILQGKQLRYPPDHPQLKLIETAAAEQVTSVPAQLPARLVWDESRTQRIYPPFAGRVGAIRVDVGQRVAAGAVLADLASPDFAVAQADTAKAEADASVAAKALARQRELYQLGIAARKDVEQAEGDAARARAEVARASARTRMYGGGAAVNQQLAIRAGIGGVVVERNINPGQELRPDQYGPATPPLFTLTDPTTLWVQVDARDMDVEALRPGQTFVLRLAALPDIPFEARVTAAADVIDPGTRTIKIRGVVDNPERRLKAEMLGTALIERAHQRGVSVPASAVTLRGAEHWVVVQTSPGVFERRLVDTSEEGARDVIVTSGIRPGEKVVSENALLLLRQFRLAEQEASAPAPGASGATPAAQPPASAASERSAS
ncbi:efflux RND transporter periplasmic adaptor subunit [Ottowia sp. SB7-C50]|uniref:efflux RND transporter periplasmic adaptor subunit n=1 Tax=Ottowia sp. SB7-C50 TaxID=3081231 RepID=UPI002953C336|nr:efflux RND transporter periplasmic adaptor subunit [Ottowia sp. SB7-C50]WOP15571.1 efflux RND transporter periplasmic adaptor subunit [Ottowia sp. SB7-C50]